MGFLKFTNCANLNNIPKYIIVTICIGIHLFLNYLRRSNTKSIDTHAFST